MFRRIFETSPVYHRLYLHCLNLTSFQHRVRVQFSLCRRFSTRTKVNYIGHNKFIAITCCYYTTSTSDFDVSQFGNLEIHASTLKTLAINTIDPLIYPCQTKCFVSIDHDDDCKEIRCEHIHEKDSQLSSIYITDHIDSSLSSPAKWHCEVSLPLKYGN